MKTKNLILVVLIISLFGMFNSCSKPDQHLKTIPSTANLVGSVDLLSTAKKAQLYDLDQYAFYNDMMKKLQEENPELHSYLSEIISNPLKTGIRYREDMFMFAEDLNSNPHMGVTMSIRNSEDFETFITNILEKTKSEMVITKKKGLSYATEKNMMIAYDNEKMLMVAHEGSGEDELFSYIKTLMNQTTEDAILSHSDFKKFKADKKDFNFWLASDALPQTPQTAMIKTQIPFETEGNYLHAHMNFEDEGIFSTAKWTFNEEIQAILDDYDFSRKFNTELLNYLPKDNYATIGFGLNPDAIYKWLNDIPSYKNMLDQANKNAPLSAEKVVNSLKGDIIVAMHGFMLPDEAETTSPGAQNQNVMPYASAIVSMNNSDVYDQIVNNMLPKGLFEEMNTYYRGKFAGFYVYFGLYNNNLIVTNDKNVIKAATDGGLEENVGKTELADIFNHSTFMYMNMDWDQYPDGLKDMMEKSMGNADFENFRSVTNYTKQMQVYEENIGEGKMEFLMKNNDGNALHTIMQMIDEQRMKMDKKKEKKEDKLAEVIQE